MRKRISRTFRDPDRPVKENYREATEKEVMDWLNGYVSGPEYVETEFGLMIKE